MVSIPAWEDEYQKPFLVNGVSIYEVLSETVNASEAGKENRKVIFAEVLCMAQFLSLDATLLYSELELDLFLPAEQLPNLVGVVPVPLPLLRTLNISGAPSRCQTSDLALVIPM